MFEGFARVWTPAVLASELAASPQGMVIAGTKVVLFRDASGTPRALLDVCPHRGAALSLGTVKDGCIECPFHGWRFDGQGAVREVPWNDGGKAPRASATTFPLREAGKLLWLYTEPMSPRAPNETVTDGPSEPADLPTEPAMPAVPEVLLRGDVRVTAMDVTFATHWTRVMENMLDWPHLPFVHRRTIGKSMVGRTRARLDIRMEERPWGFHSTIAIGGTDNPGSLAFRWPNLMELTIPAPGKTLVLHTACIPVDERSTRLLMVTARDFLQLPVFDAVFNRSNRPIVEEDRAVLESSWPLEVPPASEEASVRTDAPTLYFRKRYFAELRGRSAASIGRGVALAMFRAHDQAQA